MAKPIAPSIETWWRRRMVRRVTGGVVALLVVSLLLGLERAGYLAPMFGEEGVGLAKSQADLRRFDQRAFEVGHVTDRLVFEMEDQAGPPVEARLAHVKPTKATAPRAASLARRLIADQPVRATLYPATTRDAHGHLRLDMILPDGSRLTEHLLLVGLVRTNHQRPCPRRLELLQRQARVDAAGMWEDR